MFTTLRIYALSRKNKILGGVALVLGMAPFVVNAVSPGLYIAMCLLMGTTSDLCVPKTSHQPARTT